MVLPTLAVAAMPTAPHAGAEQPAVMVRSAQKERPATMVLPMPAVRVMRPAMDVGSGATCGDGEFCPELEAM